jgi:hypothetical protein
LSFSIRLLAGSLQYREPFLSKENLVKKVDYYAVHRPWRMPLWLGIGLGLVFTGVIVVAVALAVNLTRPLVVAAPAVAPVPAVAPIAAKVETAPPAPAAPVAPAAAQPEREPMQTAAHSHHHHSHHTHGHSTKVAAAPAPDRSQAILARHDSKEKRKAKDDLDKLLGGL